MTSNRGGTRPGAGRKPLPPDQRTEHATIRLTADQIDHLKRIGDGNLSEGIRRLLAKGV